MATLKTAAIALMAAGVLGLVYGGFTCTRGTQTAHLGPLELTVKDAQTVNVPIWASVGTMAVGGVLPVLSSRKRR